MRIFGFWFNSLGFLQKKKINLLGSETVLDSEQWVSYPDVQLTLLDPVLLGWLSVAVCMFLRAGDVKIRIAHGYRNRSYPCFPPLLYEFKAKTHTHKKKKKNPKNQYQNTENWELWLAIAACEAYASGLWYTSCSYTCQKKSKLWTKSIDLWLR